MNKTQESKGYAIVAFLILMALTMPIIYNEVSTLGFILLIVMALGSFIGLLLS